MGSAWICDRELGRVTPYGFIWALMFHACLVIDLALVNFIFVPHFESFMLTLLWSDGVTHGFQCSDSKDIISGVHKNNSICHLLSEY